MGTPGEKLTATSSHQDVDATPLEALREFLIAAQQLPHGLRVHATDPQAFRAAFDALRAQAAPLFDNLTIRSAPLNAHEIWIIKVPNGNAPA